MAASRLRLSLEETPQERSFGESLSRFFQLLRLRAVGVISPPPGTRFRVTAVAYSSTVSQTDLTPCITAAGTRVRHGIVATNFLPLGTRLRIGDEVYLVEDRMNERYNGVHIIDIWHPTTEQAIKFGVRPLEIEILGVPEARAAAPTSGPALNEAEGASIPPAPQEAAPEAGEEASGIFAQFRERTVELGKVLLRFLSVRVVVPEEAPCLE